MIIINNIEIREPNKAKEFWSRTVNKAEDIMFSVFERLPEKAIPQFVMNWMEQYINKRLSELKHNQVKNTWRKVELERVVGELNINKK